MQIVFATECKNEKVGALSLVSKILPLLRLHSIYRTFTQKKYLTRKYQYCLKMIFMQPDQSDMVRNVCCSL